MVIKTSWIVKNLKSKHGKHTCPGGTWQCENTKYKTTHPHFRMFSYILIIATRIAAVPLAKAIRVMIMLRISGVLPILLIRRSRDITVNWIRSIDSTLTNEVSWFSTAYKKAGSKTQAIAITNRLLPVSSPLFTTENMRRFDAMINVEQMIKKDFLFIYDTSDTLVKVRLDKDKLYLLASANSFFTNFLIINLQQVNR